MTIVISSSSKLKRFPLIPSVLRSRLPLFVFSSSANFFVMTSSWFFFWLILFFSWTPFTTLGVCSSFKHHSGLPLLLRVSRLGAVLYPTTFPETHGSSLWMLSV